MRISIALLVSLPLAAQSIHYPTRAGSPLTSAAKITERYRRPNLGNLEIQITVDDSKAYTAPFTFTLHHHLLPDTDLLGYVCLENEKDQPHVRGK